MSYQQKRVLVSVTSGIILFLGYCIFILPQYQLESNATDLKFWATTMLSFIGVSILINIVIQIIFHILFSVSIAVSEEINNVMVNGKSSDKVDDKLINKKIKREMVEDERDHLISLKSLRVGYIISGAGVVIALISLVLGFTPAIMLNILFLSFMLGSIIEGVVQFYFYSKD